MGSIARSMLHVQIESALYGSEELRCQDREMRGYGDARIRRCPDGRSWRERPQQRLVNAEKMQHTGSNTILERVLTAVACFVVVAFGLDMAWHAHQLSHFHGDDIRLLTDARAEPLASALLRSHSDLHFTPLHYLSAHGMSWLAPLRFDVALAVMLSFYLAGAAALYRVFCRLLPRRWAALMIGWYGVNGSLALQFLWWGSAMHRFPYILFTALAVYFYLVFRDDGRWRSAAAVLVSTAFGCGFFIKTVFTPLILAAVEIAHPTRQEPPVRVRIGVLLVVLTLGCGLWFALSQSLIDQQVRVPGAFWLRYVERRSWAVLVESCFGGPFSPATLGVWRWAAIAATAMTVGWSVRLRIHAALAWILGGFLVSMSIAATALGARSMAFLATDSIARYVFELMPVVCVFAALALAHPVNAAPTDPAGNTDLAARRRRVFCVASMVLITVLGITSRINSMAMLSRAAPPKAARVYLNNLVAGISDVSAGSSVPITVAEGFIPKTVLGLSMGERLSELMPLVDSDARVVPRSEAAYVVTPDGRVKKLR